MAGAGSGRRLSGGEIALVLVVTVLVLVFLVMLAQRLLPGQAGGGQTSTASQTSPDEDGTADEDVVGEDLSALDYTFVAPSGNIACAMSPARVVCGIDDVEYSVPADVTEGCTGNAGHFLHVTADTSGLLCDTSGSSPTIDTGDAEELPYGQSLERGAFRCLSEESGVTCEHTGSGRSIAVARAAYSLG